jgi:hypothetical protein
MHFAATCSRDAVKVHAFDDNAFKDTRPLKVKAPRAIVWNHSCTSRLPAASARFELPVLGRTAPACPPSVLIARPLC